MSEPYERLYFVTRKDLPEGYRAAQLIHAAQSWDSFFDMNANSTVIVYEVPDEKALEGIHRHLHRVIKADMALWHEPDMDFQLTALATTAGPLTLPLLGGGKMPKRKKRKRWVGQGSKSPCCLSLSALR